MLPDSHTSHSLDAWLLWLADAESALQGNADERQWALDVPIPLLCQDALDPDVAAALLADGPLRSRWDRVFAATDADSRFVWKTGDVSFLPPDGA
jgi:hypothetical protein